MAVGEIFLAAFLQVLFQKLMSRELLNFARREGVHKKLKTWSTTLQMIQAVLSDAEEKQLTSNAVKLWLDDLRDLAYDVEDVLDKFYTELLRRKIENLHQASSSKVWSFIPTCCTSFGCFMLNIDSEIEKITGRLEIISQRKDKLGLTDVGPGSETEWKRPASSSLPDGPVIGRDEDKKKIVESLLRDDQGFVNFHVVAIVGMPGVGKTTLSGLVFNDDAMKHFDIKVWVSVSADFNYERLTETILKSITEERYDEFSKNQDRLSKVLAGKKFLIVLDDIWNKNYDLWSNFQSPFRLGAQGSKILVTTRDGDVANLMGAINYYNLECVSEDDCWEIFVQHAFLNRNICEPSDLESLRKKIVAKCNGLPLAARTLGGLLGYKKMDEWEGVLNSRLWFQSDQSNILPQLRLSYHYLPSHLKRCFAYCSILPEDYEFEEKLLILLWMAEGLIQQPEGSRQMEDLGREYFHELFSRSLFQKSRKDESMYVMHDLVNDLALWVAGEISFRLEVKVDGDKRCRIFKKARHSSYTSAQFDGVQRFEALTEVKHLRTFLPLAQSLSYHGENYLSDEVTLQILPKLQYLRVLSLKGYHISKLPDSIGELKLLRYLDLSYTAITILPESIITLYNLQTLLLECCKDLDELPAGIKNLTSLRHLNISNQKSLKGMPPDLGKLTNLQTLSNFVVGKDSGSSGVGELATLLHLNGTLHISGLENVNGAKDAVMANLAGKNGIDALIMEWNEGDKADPDVFEMLQPPRMLKELTVMRYGCQKFPTWMGNPSFSNMVLMRLEDCNGCRLLPPLGQLVSLKELIIKNMSEVESIGNEFYGKDCLKPFPLLETLSFENMENWKDWFPVETYNGIEGFPQLKELFVTRCPMLKGKLPKTLPSLAKLVVAKCEQLTVSIPSSQMLSELEISHCEEVVCENHADFKSLKSIKISGVPEFRYPTERFMQELTKLEDFVVDGCKGMTCLLRDELRQLTSLRHLEIGNSSLQHLTLFGEEKGQVQLWMLTKLETLELRRCNSLLKTPEGLHLSLLKRLYIYECPGLIYVPVSCLPSSLRDLYIERCENLKSLVQEEYSSNNNCTSNCLELLDIRECPSLKSISSADGSLPARFKELYVSDCHVLRFLSSGKLPDNLRRLDIEDCGSLIWLSSEGELPEALEHLEIWSCDRLRSLSSEAKLPKALKHLEISYCGQLKSITDMFYGNTCLQYIEITYCKKLRFLPEGLHHLVNLSQILIHECENLVSFPEGGLPASNLSDVTVTSDNLVGTPEGIHSLSCLHKLEIYFSEGWRRVLGQEGFPPNLTSLTIWGIEVSKPLFQLGLHRLTSLRELKLSGEATDMVSFPPEQEHEGRMRMMLPNSLITLRIWYFENLEKLSAGIQCLTSLQNLSIFRCKKLKCLPKQGLPLSLLKLEIEECPLLEKQCTRDKGPLWPLIAHIPHVWLSDF